MESPADILTELGRRLENFGSDAPSHRATQKAEKANPWFDGRSIRLAVDAIRRHMLSPEVLKKWLARYPDPKPHNCKLNIIMAGNIPLVGFADLMYGLASGWNCYIKPSSKDRELIMYVVGLLCKISPAIKIAEGLCAAPDAMIATGGDNTIRLLRSHYPGTRSLFRGSRSSVAVLTGGEEALRLERLVDDILDHSGLGCRNVSMLLLPAGYDIAPLVAALSAYAPVNPKYCHNYLQNKAMATMQGKKFIDGGFFTLVQSDDFPQYVSRIAYRYYNGLPEVEIWLKDHADQIQCVVADSIPGAVDFGQAQFPYPWDYADGADVMDFLRNY